MPRLREEMSMPREERKRTLAESVEAMPGVRLVSLRTPNYGEPGRYGDRYYYNDMQNGIRWVERDLKRSINRIGDLEETNYGGTLLWKISEFSQRKREALSGVVTSIFSPSFWTTRHGYKMCARLDLNGHGTGHGTHMSVFFMVMRGPYDALLEWPFNRRVIIELLSQNGGPSETCAFTLDPASPTSQRPTTEENSGIGPERFVPLSMLDSPNQQFVKDDVMFLKVTAYEI